MMNAYDRALCPGINNWGLIGLPTADDAKTFNVPGHADATNAVAKINHGVEGRRGAVRNSISVDQRGRDENRCTQIRQFN